MINLDEAQIYAMYLGLPLPIGKKINSPLPYREDNTPSFVLHVSKKGNLYWRDYAINQENIGFNAVALVGQMLGVSGKQALIDINNKVKQGFTPPKIKIKVKKENKALYGKPLSDWEWFWWRDNLLFPKSLLEYFNVLSLQGYFRGDTKVWESKENLPAYLYLEYNKAYRPTAKKGRKHRGINNGDVLEGWNQLPQTADHFVLQTSMKDVMCFRRMGYLGAAPPSENSMAPLLKRVREINGRFRHKIAICDTDNAGRKQAAFIREHLGWRTVFCPNTKDPSDSVQLNKNYFEISQMMSEFNFSKYHWK